MTSRAPVTIAPSGTSPDKASTVKPALSAVLPFSVVVARTSLDVEIAPRSAQVVPEVSGDAFVAPHVGSVGELVPPADLAEAYDLPADTERAAEKMS